MDQWIDVAGGGAGVAAVAAPVALADAETGPSELAELVTRLEQVASVGLWRLGDEGLRVTLGQVGRARVALARMELGCVTEVLDRGVASTRGFSAVDWVGEAQGQWAPLPDPRDVAAVVTVAQAMSEGQPGRDALAGALDAGRLSVGKAAQIARWTKDVRGIADGGELDSTLTRLVELGSDDLGEGAGDGDQDDAPAPRRSRCRGLSCGELARVLRQASRLIKPARDLEDLERRQRLARSLVKSAGPAGMSTYRMQLDPQGAAVLDAAVAALSAPVPGSGGERDERLPATRRADALLTLVERAVAAGAGPGVDEQGHPVDPVPGTGDKAQVVVTISYEALVEGLRGAGVTMGGEVLSPSVVRRMACDARLLPAVLGGDGQVLDLGRGRRLFSQVQRLLVWRRDRECTFPGCTVPATWCDVHHVRWWSRGGSTDRSNAALLCQRHHTVVHERDLEATVTASGVSWHTVPG